VNNSLLKRILFSCSLASFCQVKNLSLLISVFKPANAFNHERLSTPLDFFTLITNVAIFFVIIFVASVVIFEKPELSRIKIISYRSLMAVAAVVSTINLFFVGGWVNTTTYLQYVRPLFYANLPIQAVVVLGGLALLAFLLRFRKQAGKTIVFCVILCAPFSLIFVGQSLYYALVVAPNHIQKPQVVLVKKKPAGKTKVVFLLFDEWDYRLSFVDRPAGIKLKELDNLRKNSVFFTNAYPPANNTLYSIPAITSGVMIKEAVPIGENDLSIVTTKGQTTSWEKLPSLFKNLKNEGYSSGVLGSFLPYCRVLGKDIDECKWYNLATQETSYGDTFFEKLVNQNRTLIETPRYSPFGQSLLVKEHIKNFEQISDDARTMLANDDHDFVYIHFPIPHSPYIYNPQKDDLSLTNNTVSGYANQLQLLDKTVGELRVLLQFIGLWDRTTLIVTSDHWNRSSMSFDGRKDHRVPLMIKCPGGQKGSEYSLPINTIMLSDVIHATVHGALSNSKDLSSHLSDIRSDALPVEMFDLL